MLPGDICCVKQMQPHPTKFPTFFFFLSAELVASMYAWARDSVTPADALSSCALLAWQLCGSTPVAAAVRGAPLTSRSTPRSTAHEVNRFVACSTPSASVYTYPSVVSVCTSYLNVSIREHATLRSRLSVGGVCVCFVPKCFRLRRHATLRARLSCFSTCSPWPPFV